VNAFVCGPQALGRYTRPAVANQRRFSSSRLQNQTDHYLDLDRVQRSEKSSAETTSRTHETHHIDVVAVHNLRQSQAALLLGVHQLAKRLSAATTTNSPEIHCSKTGHGQQRRRQGRIVHFALTSIQQAEKDDNASEETSKYQHSRCCLYSRCLRVARPTSTHRQPREHKILHHGPR